MPVFPTARARGASDGKTRDERVTSLRTAGFSVVPRGGAMVQMTDTVPVDGADSDKVVWRAQALRLQDDAE